MLRLAPALLCILALGCRSGAPYGEVYGGVGITAGPGVGATALLGQRFLDTESFDFAFEAAASRQEASGKFFQAQLGVRQKVLRGPASDVVFRYGISWFRANGEHWSVDRAGDYIGGYGGIGYEWSFSPRVSLTPELRLTVAGGEGSIGVAIVPQVGLILTVRF